MGCPNRPRVFGLIQDSHEWEKITGVMYVEDPSPWVDNAKPMAGARCVHCGEVGLREMYGSFTWWKFREISREEALEKAREAAQEAEQG